MTQNKNDKFLKKFRDQSGSLEYLHGMVGAALGAATWSDHAEFQIGVALQAIGGADPRSENINTNANKIPDALRALGINTRNTKGTNPTAHGELMVLKDADPAQKNIMACNFPNCPTCTKKAILHGIYALVIDARIERGHITPRAFLTPKYEERFRKGWEELSLPMLRAAGVHVLGVDSENDEIGIINKGLRRKDRPNQQRLDTYIQPLAKIENSGMGPHFGKATRSGKYYFSEQAVAEIEKMDLIHLANEISTRTGKRAAVVRAYSKDGKPYILGAAEQDVPYGMSADEAKAIAETFKGDRYSVSICPITRLMMAAARRGLSLAGNGKKGQQAEACDMACTYMPKAGRLIDLAACGLGGRLYVPQLLYKAALATDDSALIGMLEETGALNFKPKKDRRLTIALQTLAEIGELSRSCHQPAL